MGEMANITELPWHQRHWQRVMSSIDNDRLPHAFLLTGASGLGKRHFANRLVASLLCDTPSDTGWPCGGCRGCQLLKAGTHPDYRSIEPEEPGKAIKIDVIRGFVQQESLTSHSGGYKIVTIEPADALNIAAANSLLKTLEEPVAKTLMLLITDQPNRLPATIRSRCSLFKFNRPKSDVALDWLTSAVDINSDPALLLSLAHGATLKAVTLSDPEMLEQRRQMLEEFSAILKRVADPVAVAARWDKMALNFVVEWFTGWLVDMIRIQVQGQNAVIINVDQKTLLRDLGSHVKSKSLHLMLERLYQARRMLGGQLNTQMLLEGLLLEWSSFGERNE